MASIVLIQSVLLSLVMVQQHTSAAQDGFLLLALPLRTSPPNPTAPCLVRGQPPNRRDDYTYVSGSGGYKVHTQAAVWADARLICQEEGGHLAIINSVAESKAISQVFQKSDPIVGSALTDDALIGFHDFFREGEYVTIHGESLQKAGYDQWDSGQPNNFEIQNCGAVNKNGRLVDLWCNKPHGFICEIPPSQNDTDIANSTSHQRDLE